MKIQRSIEVTYEATNDPAEAAKWIANLPDVFAADFETAIKYTAEEVAESKVISLDTTIPRLERVRHQAIANATALGHPSHCTITHCSMAASESEGLVFIIDNQEIADVVLDFLTETEKKQIWHNYCYDGRFLRYFQRKDVKNFEDTQIFAKTLINHVEIFKARTSLKDLAGAWYGDWGISADNFTLAQQYEPKVLHYAAIDACSTFKLWHYLNSFCREASEEQKEYAAVDG